MGSEKRWEIEACCQGIPAIQSTHRWKTTYLWNCQDFLCLEITYTQFHDLTTTKNDDIIWSIFLVNIIS